MNKGGQKFGRRDEPTPASMFRSNISLTVQAELRRMNAPMKPWHNLITYSLKGDLVRKAAIVRPQASCSVVNFDREQVKVRYLPNGQNIKTVPVG